MRELTLSFIKAIVLLTFILNSFAASPTKSHFSAKLTDSGGTGISVTSETLQLSLVPTADNSCILYRETHTVTTDSTGLINVQIGGGTATLGNYLQAHFQNNIALTCSAGPGTHTPTSTESRKILVTLAGESYGSLELLSQPFSHHADLASDIKVGDKTSVTPQTSDSLMISDSSDSDNSKRITISDLQTLIDTNTDTNTTYTAGNGLALSSTTFNMDINSLASITPLAADEIIISDASNSNAISKISLTQLQTLFTAGAGDISEVIAGSGLSGGSTTGSATLNVDINGQSSITPVLTDELLISDTSNSNAINSISLTDLQTLINTDSGGDITSVIAGTALTTGGTTGAVTLNVDQTGFTDLTVDSTTLHVDSSNNRVGIGLTSPLVPFHVEASKTSGYIAKIENTSTNTGGDILHLQSGASDPTVSTTYIKFSNQAGTTQGYIAGFSGGDQVQYRTTSDRRLKENIVNAPSYLDKIMKLKVRSYNFKNRKRKSIGFIAQEIYEIMPESEISVPGGENSKTHPWTISYGRITPILTKGLQEVKTKLDAEVNQLKIQNQLMKDYLCAKDSSAPFCS